MANLLNRSLEKGSEDLVGEWIATQLKNSGRRLSAAEEKQFDIQAREFVGILKEATGTDGTDIMRPEWAAARDFLSQLSTSRARSGSTPVETVLFVMALKEPIL